MDEGYKRQINPFVAGLTGVMIGAGVGAVTTKVLSDKKTRNKLMHMMSDARDRMMDYANKAKKAAQQTREVTEHRLRRVRRAVKKTASAMK